MNRRILLFVFVTLSVAIATPASGVTAQNPRPTDGEPNVPLDVCKLVWYPGAYVHDHNVYFSETRAEVNDACDSALVSDHQEPNYYPEGEGCISLNPGRTYYWRVDEVNDACDPCLWPGAVWSFTTIPYVIIDDFNDYDTTATIGQNPLRFAVGGPWKDWHNLPPAYQGGTAFLIGAPGYDTDPCHSAPKAMWNQYDTGWGIPLLERRFVEDPQNWTQGGLTTLVIWFYGDATDGVIPDPCFATDLFVTLGDDDDNDGDVDDSYTIYYVADSGGDVGDLTAKEWIEWNIALQDFNDGNDVSPDKIRSIALGIKDGSTGNVYYDDILLYVRRCVPMYAVDITSDPEGNYEGAPDCYVDYWDLKHFGACWLDINAQPNGVPDECDTCDIHPPGGDGEVNFEDYAFLMQYWLMDQWFPFEE